MKLVVLLSFVALAAAGELHPIAILKQNIETQLDGSYTHGFESENGIILQESGQQKQITPEASGTTSSGIYSYPAPDGTIISVIWTADENGFQPQGDHLPVAPPMPDYVVKMLDDLRAAGKLRK